MFDKLKNLFVNNETYSPVALFEVKNVISGEGEIRVPEVKKEIQKKPQEKKPETEKAPVQKSRPAKKSNGILDIVSQYSGPVNSTEILAKCLENSVCSRATFFRKINKLVDEGKLKRTKDGKEVFYEL